MFSSLIGFLVSAFGVGSITQVALTGAVCNYNGKVIPCPEIFNSPVLGIIFIAFFAFAMVVAIAGFILWIMMLIHVATKPVDHKPTWIVVLALTGWIGALLYYFMVKRPFDAGHVAPATGVPLATPTPPVSPTPPVAPLQ